MLNFLKTQDSKPDITDKNGNLIVDLIIKDVDLESKKLYPTATGIYLVDAESAMRADIVSKHMYGYLDAIEGILKFNGITNPFCLEEGDWLYTFDVASMSKNLRSPSQADASRKDIRDQYITPEKKSTVDPALQSFSKRDDARAASPVKGDQPALPPNYAAFGDTEIQVRNGKIVFGPNVTKQDDDCDKPLSKSEFISRLIKNRLSTK